jgi:hypothetical protein
LWSSGSGSTDLTRESSRANGTTPASTATTHVFEAGVQLAGEPGEDLFDQLLSLGRAGLGLHVHLDGGQEIAARSLERLAQ